MKAFLTLSLTVLFAITAFAADFPAGSPTFLKNYAAARKAAAETGKPILLVFSAGYCPPCQAMKKSVYPDKTVQPYHNKFHWVYVDTEQPENAELAATFQVNAIPHIQFVKSDGKAFAQWLGGATPTQFAGILEQVVRTIKQS
jgi:thioredoxin-related protein